MLRPNRPVLAFFDAIKALRVRQLALILKAGYEPNLLLNGRGQNGLQFMINYFGATEAHYRLQAPINKSAYLSIAKLLLDAGLDPNALDLLADETVLFDAIRYNDREMVALLLNYVDLALRNKNGETALMCAARFAGKQVMRLMLEHLRHLEMDGYFLRQRNRFGLTALEIARAENLEAAKVLTKHLIAYGQHAGAVLARSVSHHQLASADYAPLPVGVGGGGVGGIGGGVARHSRRRHPNELLAAAADDFFSASDYDDDDLLAGPSGLASGRARVAHRAPVRAQLAPAYAYYDPKAAEFSQYLLDQQAALDSGCELPLARGGGGAGASSRRAQLAAAAARTMSEEEDAVYGGGAGGAGGQLVRSRSCMLGPSAGVKKPGGGGPSNEQLGGKGQGGWQDQSSGTGAGQ